MLPAPRKGGEGTKKKGIHSLGARKRTCRDREKGRMSYSGIKSVAPEKGAGWELTRLGKKLGEPAWTGKTEDLEAGQVPGRDRERLVRYFLGLKGRTQKFKRERNSAISHEEEKEGVAPGGKEKADSGVGRHTAIERTELRVEREEGAAGGDLDGLWRGKKTVRGRGSPQGNHSKLEGTGCPKKAKPNREGKEEETEFGWKRKREHER